MVTRSALLRSVQAGLLIAIGVTNAQAQPSGVDWKYYGGATFDDGTHDCFYDAKGVERKTQDNIKVWAKCILQRDLDAIDPKKDYNGILIDNIARKMANYYMPPYGDLEKLTIDQIMSMIEYEEIADIGYIQPTERIFYEVNCTEKMERELSISATKNGITTVINKPQEWSYVPPEGNLAVLYKILGPRK